MKMLFCVVAMLVAGFSLPAQAHGWHRVHHRHSHSRHHAKAAHGRHFRPAIDLDRAVNASPLVQTALRYVGSRNPTSFRGGPWCGAYALFIARKVGVHAPPNPNLARNWAHAGPRLHGPVAGAIMVMPHHVGFVMAILGRFVELVSGNHSHRVGIGLYPIRRAIAFVDPVRG